MGGRTVETISIHNNFCRKWKDLWFRRVFCFFFFLLLWWEQYPWGLAVASLSYTAHQFWVHRLSCQPLTSFTTEVCPPVLRGEGPVVLLGPAGWSWEHIALNSRLRTYDPVQGHRATGAALTSGSATAPLEKLSVVVWSQPACPCSWEVFSSHNDLKHR